jgi:Cu+-exporting ATPase
MRVKDPVCGSTITIDAAVRQEDHDGWLYFFCSAECHRRFLAAPAGYAERPTWLDPPPGRDRKGKADTQP